MEANNNLIAYIEVIQVQIYVVLLHRGTFPYWWNLPYVVLYFVQESGVNKSLYIFLFD